MMRLQLNSTGGKSDLEETRRVNGERAIISRNSLELTSVTSKNLHLVNDQVSLNRIAKSLKQSTREDLKTK